VTVRGKGKGGRNTELALVFSLGIGGKDGITLLAAGTDGTDGPTDAAGAFADGTTAGKAREAGLEPSKYLEDNDSYTFFDRAGGLLKTGPTGTNVMDIDIILLT
jgi:glycerate-2-kinase